MTFEEFLNNVNFENLPTKNGTYSLLTFPNGEKIGYYEIIPANIFQNPYSFVYIPFNKNSEIPKNGDLIDFGNNECLLKITDQTNSFKDIEAAFYFLGN